MSLAGGIAGAPRSSSSVVRLPGGAWTLWRTLVLRGAGFPVRLVAPLATERAAAAADRYEQAVDHMRRCQAAAIAALDRTSAAAADHDAQQRLRRLRRKIRRGGVPSASGAELDCLAAAVAARDAARAALAARYEADAIDVAGRVRELAADPRLREATIWQSRGTGDAAWSRVCGGRGKSSERRRAAEMIAMRAQRYAVKNDSIGFFGPAGWGSIVDEPWPLDARPGPRLVAARAVYFEGWCIDAIAERLNREPGVRPWTCPRLHTGVWSGPDAVYVPLHGQVPLSAAERALVRMCDGRRSAREIAGAIVSGGAVGLSTEREVFDLLEHLVARRILTWGLEVASQLYPERDLDERLRRIADATVRARCQEVLDALVGARAQVAAAAGDPDQLDRRIGELADTFVRLTGRAATRRHGKAYAGRSLVYEDCRRGCDVDFGRAFVDAVGPPLTLVLDAARWLAAELASAARRYIRACFAELRASTAGEIDAQCLYDYVLAAGPQPLDALAADVTRRYQQAWQSVLDLAEHDRYRRYVFDDIAPAARRAFATSGRSWSRAEYFSPDLMIGAAGAEAFRRGDFHVVLGELHGTNSLLWSGFLSQHPAPDRVIDALREDTREQTVVVTQVVKEKWLARLNTLVLPSFWRVEFGTDLPILPACQSLPTASLVCADDGEGIEVRARDGRVAFDALELFGVLLCQRLHEMISHRLPAVGHTPRVTVGRLTIARETWRVTPAELPFLAGDDRSLQFAATRRWARERGMPRRVFYKSPVETKPCYLDLASSLYVQIFLRLMQQAPADAPVRIVEMSPDVHEAWLPDAEGERYTCELRLAAHHAGEEP